MNHRFFKASIASTLSLLVLFSMAISAQGGELTDDQGAQVNLNQNTPSEFILRAPEVRFVKEELEPAEINKILSTVDDCAEEKNQTSVSLPQAKIALDLIINMGKAIWNIVEAGAPVLNINSVSANALPKGLTCWTQLAQWNNPISRKYEVSYKNIMGFTVVRLSYRVMFTSGGTYMGTGKYLNRVTIVPDRVDVSWGFELNSTVEVPSIVNVGTQDDPIAGAELILHWNVKSPFHEKKNSVSYFVRGDGQFIEL